jgi:hypothetical protein
MSVSPSSQRVLARAPPLPGPQALSPALRAPVTLKGEPDRAWHALSLQDLIACVVIITLPGQESLTNGCLPLPLPTHLSQLGVPGLLWQPIMQCNEVIPGAWSHTGGWTPGFRATVSCDRTQVL